MSFRYLCPQTGTPREFPKTTSTALCGTQWEIAQHMRTKLGDLKGN